MSGSTVGIGLNLWDTVKDVAGRTKDARVLIRMMICNYRRIISDKSTVYLVLINND